MPNKPVDLYPEFYNDVFGPIMAPGSSSHMAAPCRAGYMCISLLGGDEVAEIVVEMDNDGSFKGTFGTMNEDLGMLNGALGHMPDYADFFGVNFITVFADNIHHIYRNNNGNTNLEKLRSEE